MLNPLGPWPRLFADVTARNLDLSQVTSTFSIGSITGRLDADVTGLELVHTVADLSTFLTDKVAEGHGPSTAQWSLGSPDSTR